MTRETYSRTAMPYQPKHYKKEYHVWVVCYEDGPLHEFDVYGLEEAKQSIIPGAWQYGIIRKSDGKVMNV